MRLFKFSVTVLIMILAFAVSGEKGMKVKPKEKAAVRMRAEYIFVNEKTPEHVLKSAVAKGLNPAFILKSSDAAWMREKLAMIQRSSPLIFVEGKLTPLERKYFEEIIKYTDYRAIIICYSKECSEDTSWRHPLVKRLYTISRGKDGSIVMEGLGIKGAALKNSVLDDKDFIDSPVVKSGLYFEKFSFAFISLDSNVDKSFFDDAVIVVYYSDSEKKMSDFVEKKLLMY